MHPLFSAVARCCAAGDSAGAEGRLRALLETDPNDGDAWCDLAKVVADRGQLPAALVMARRAQTLLPDDSRALNTLGNTLHQVRRYDEALVYLDMAVERGAGRDALLNRALTHYETGDLAASEADFVAALGGAWNASISAEMAYPVLASGDLRRGFALMEHRWLRLGRSLVWDLGVPEWCGEDLTGKTLLVHQDQGHGDVINFCRYLRHDRFARTNLIFAVEQPLVRLLAANFSDLRVIDRNTAPDDANFHVAVSSLPYHLRVSRDEICGKPYLTVEREPIWSHGPFNVGVVWAVRPHAPRRSMPLERMLPLALIPGVKLYSLQYGPHAADIARLGAGALIEDLSPQVRDFADSAALMSQLDLVVSADSAPAHLAGALGVPCVVFSDYVPCWRWLRGRTDTPWYDSMQLVTQRRPGEWGPVVDDIVRIISEQAHSEDRRTRSA